MSLESHPRSYLDILTRQWTSDELGHMKLTVESGLNSSDKTVKIAYETLSEPNFVYGSSGIAGWVKTTIENTKGLLWTDPSSIYHVKQAFDRIVKNEIQQENAEDLSSLSRQERYERIKIMLARLNNLKTNLSNHNAVIEEFNKRFKTNFSACENHETILIDINHQIQKLAHDQNKIMRKLRKIVENKLLDLNDNINFGQIIDRRYFYTRQHHHFLRELAVIEPLEKQEELRLRYQNLINRGYIQTVLNQIKMHQCKLPPSLHHILSQLGLSDERIQDEAHRLTPRLISFLERIYLTENLSKLSHTDIENRLLGHFSLQFGHALRYSDHQTERFQTIVMQIYQFENGWFKEEVGAFETAAKLTDSFMENERISRHENIRKEKRKQLAQEFHSFETAIRQPPEIAIRAILKNQPIKQLIEEDTQNFNGFIKQFERDAAKEQLQHQEQVRGAYNAFVERHRDWKDKSDDEVRKFISNQEFIHSAINTLQSNPELPINLRNVLTLFRLSEDQIQEIRSKINTHLIEFLTQLPKAENLSRLSREDISLKMFFQTIHLVGKELNLHADQLERFTSFLKQLRNINRAWNEREEILLGHAEKTKQDLLRKFQSSSYKRQEMPKAFELLKTNAQTPSFTTVVQDLLATQNIIQFIQEGPPETFQEFLNKLQAHIETTQANHYDSISRAFTDCLRWKDLSDFQVWKLINARHCLFSFRQSGEDPNFVLSDGACTGINYTWTIALLKSPLKPIRSIQDLVPRPPPLEGLTLIERELLEPVPLQKFKIELLAIDARSNVTRKIRFRQAANAVNQELAAKFSTAIDPRLVTKTYGKETAVKLMRIFAQSNLLARKEIVRIPASIVKNALKENTADREEVLLNGLLMPTFVLQQDNVNGQVFAHRANSDLMVLIDRLFISESTEEPPLEMARSSGIISIGMDRIARGSRREVIFLNSHVLGLQIDNTHRLYQFWDANAGFYRFNSLEELKAQLQLYLTTFYANKYNLFTPIQYYLK